MRYLLDSNICIYLLKGRAEVLKRFQTLSEGDVAMSIITYAELRAGIEMQADKVHNEAVLERLITRIPILPWDTDCAVAYGQTRALLPERKRNVFDRMIAAHAITMGLILVTNNTADFVDYPGIRLENWV
jgi:tRNA(fMet)-specific endonuclease VapC